MNYMDKVVRGITYDGNRFKSALLMACGSYAYTRSFDGSENENGSKMDFGRWYAFKCAVEIFFDYLWKSSAPTGTKP